MVASSADVDSLSPAPPVAVAGAAKPQLFVVVDTEEEFDWSAPFRRENVGVRAMRQIGGGQRLFDDYGLKPTYVTDYPVASQSSGFEPLKGILSDGRCEVGAHLHPWVNPPHDEAVTRANSFMCNLPVALQRAKLTTLCREIEDHLGVRPVAFKAGRYGLGAATLEVLDEMGFEVDNSVCPRLDYSGEGGPSFVRFDSRPFFFASHQRLLEVPCTVEFVGLPPRLGGPLHRMASKPVFERLRALGILARSGLVNRIMLSPEGNTLDEMKALTRSLFRAGCRTFTLSFHSPSLDPGHTPYVRTEQDLDLFLGRIRGYCDFFFGELAGVASTFSAFRRSLGRPAAGAGA
jgi:hypothetical protein